ncbi:magnesium and cobalt transport protein CorA [Aquimarina sp. AD10]|uniref:magnesium/cobalt transporter CorA n=1 Tax=Aquimarina TaxID=290174 RepID=UPI000E4EE2DE|nr:MULTISPECIES: magnesium/cobalt transporter CorA [Aquimarina]AXT62039.1 magnesium and cobalt transport protein CorA [Aquimarina sp. AD10]RKM99973.1 magnesium and cobalt transport protein CorA [Aquimarina sp. AD10]
MKKSKSAPKKNRRPKSSQSLGKAPGTVVYIGEKEHLPTKIEIQDYTKEVYHVSETDRVEDIFTFKGNDRTTWINVNGLSHTNEITQIGEHYGLHPLLLEDIVNTDQRPKIDEYDTYLFLVLKMMYFNKNHEFIVEHISIVLGKDYVITFQESDEDIFDPVRARITNPKSRIRGSGADYLAYSLLDAIFDNYFVVIDNLGDKVELLEEQLFNEKAGDTITQDIQSLKREILRIRRSILPLREVIGRVVKSETGLIQEKNTDYYRDLYDHIIHIHENIDVYREMIWGLMDMYMTTISNKMNGIMKVLTIISTIFIPLTFIVGVYGMNFENMPELKWKYSYLVLWGIMIMLFVSLLIFFRKKKWL